MLQFRFILTTLVIFVTANIKNSLLIHICILFLCKIIIIIMIIIIIIPDVHVKAAH